MWVLWTFPTHSQTQANHCLRDQFFFKNGVPKWRGTGYYYSRFRPSIVHVFFFLVLLSSLIHYAILRVNYRRDKQRIDYFTRAALAKAGGSGVLTSGSATPTTETGSLISEGQDGVLSSIIDQVDSATSPTDSSAPVISKRQAKLQAREAKRDKTKRDPAASQAASGTATPVSVAAPSRRRKVRVPMIEGEEYSQTLELVVVDGQVFMVSVPLQMIPTRFGPLTMILFYSACAARRRRSYLYDHTGSSTLVACRLACRSLRFPCCKIKDAEGRRGGGGRGRRRGERGRCS